MKKPKTLGDLRKERIKQARKADYLRFLASRKETKPVNPWKTTPAKPV